MARRREMILGERASPYYKWREISTKLKRREHIGPQKGSPCMSTSRSKNELG